MLWYKSPMFTEHEIKSLRNYEFKSINDSLIEPLFKQYW